jgi:hypothetical protein
MLEPAKSGTVVTDTSAAIELPPDNRPARFALALLITTAVDDVLERDRRQRGVRCGLQAGEVLRQSVDDLRRHAFGIG